MNLKHSIWQRQSLDHRRGEKIYAHVVAYRMEQQIGDGISALNAMKEHVNSNGSANANKSTSTSNLQSDNGNNSSSSSSNNNNSNNNKQIIEESTTELKIISQLKSMEQFNEKRRIFLNNTLSEERKSHSNENGSVQHSFKEQLTEIKEENATETDERITSTSLNVTPINLYSSTLPRQKKPPPKPPMLSRTHSLGLADTKQHPLTPIVTPHYTSPYNTAFHFPNLSTAKSENSPKITQSEPVVVATASISTIYVPAPTQVSTVEMLQPLKQNGSLPIQEISKETTMHLQEDTPVLRRVERPLTSQPPDLPKHVSASHYERLLEDLKCPGCSTPMKGPTLLCNKGHSVCEQCTRMVMICPICKESFTKIRSLTVESLCSKAHFRCTHANGGCTVRLQVDLLNWHEKQCIYKPMKCFMGRVWGECSWHGREVDWKEHLESEHANKVFNTNTVDLCWDLAAKQKPLTGFYVFQVYNEMFNFFEVYDQDRVLFTMTCTSNIKERKQYFAFEVTILHEDNEALSLTQKFPVHSEYDRDILLEGTCPSISLTDLAKFITEQKKLHYRVHIVEMQHPRISKLLRNGDTTNATQQTGTAAKESNDFIITGKLEARNSADEAMLSDINDTFEQIRKRYKDSSANDSEFEVDIEAVMRRRWGTPKLHFNRKYLRNNSTETPIDNYYAVKWNTTNLPDDKVSICSTTNSMSYKKRLNNRLRKSFRTIKTELNDINPFGKHKNAQQTADATKPENGFSSCNLIQRCKHASNIIEPFKGIFKIISKIGGTKRNKI